MESFQNTKRVWSRGKYTHSSQTFFSGQKKKKNEQKINHKSAPGNKYPDPFRGSCHLCISSRQQLPATHSSCHPAKGHLSIFMRSSEHFKAAHMTKYLTAFICLLAIFTPLPCRRLPDFPDNILLCIQVLLGSQAHGLSHCADGEAEALER